MSCNGSKIEILYVPKKLKGVFIEWCDWGPSFWTLGSNPNKIIRIEKFKLTIMFINVAWINQMSIATVNGTSSIYKLCCYHIRGLFTVYLKSTILYVTSCVYFNYNKIIPT
jgi:hypothetical protein